MDWPAATDSAITIAIDRETGWVAVVRLQTVSEMTRELRVPRRLFGLPPRRPRPRCVRITHPLLRRYRRILRATRDPDDGWVSGVVHPSAPPWVYEPPTPPRRASAPTLRPRHHTAPLHRRAPIRAAGWSRRERDAARRRSVDAWAR